MYNIIQNSSDFNLESRLNALESEISELKSLLLLNESPNLHKIKNRWARGDSNA